MSDETRSMRAQGVFCDARSPALEAEVRALLEPHIAESQALARAVGCVLELVGRHPRQGPARVVVWRDEKRGVLGRVVMDHPRPPPEDMTLLRGPALKRAQARAAHPPDPKPYTSGDIVLLEPAAEEEATA